jgi:hypothetical protein
MAQDITVCIKHIEAGKIDVRLTYVDNSCTIEHGREVSYVKPYIGAGDSVRLVYRGESWGDVDGARKRKCVYTFRIPDREEAEGEWTYSEYLWHKDITGRKACTVHHYEWFNGAWCETSIPEHHIGMDID